MWGVMLRVYTMLHAHRWVLLMPGLLVACLACKWDEQSVVCWVVKPVLFSWVTTFDCRPNPRPEVPCSSPCDHRRISIRMMLQAWHSTKCASYMTRERLCSCGEGFQYDYLHLCCLLWVYLVQARHIMSYHCRSFFFSRLLNTFKWFWYQNCSLVSLSRCGGP